MLTPLQMKFGRSIKEGQGRIWKETEETGVGVRGGGDISMGGRKGPREEKEQGAGLGLVGGCDQRDGCQQVCGVGESG